MQGKYKEQFMFAISGLLILSPIVILPHMAHESATGF